MDLETEIIINQYGQGVLSENELIEKFAALNSYEKRNHLQDLHHLIIHSKVDTRDLEEAVKNSNLKPSFTPCVILGKGLNHGNFNKVINLPENELNKAYKLLINLFRIGYYRRFVKERGNPNKWWYWDLTDNENVDKVKRGLI